ncbi:MAG: hypothetical protein F6K21_05635 [Symploca sp. SIO2D2]|nr:hypothetical protein [Symploca sp. SIO2D2]
MPKLQHLQGGFVSNELRMAYELALGKTISDSQWWRVRKILDRQQLEVNQVNLQLLARLRLLLPGSAVAVSGLLTAYQKVEDLTQNAQASIKGAEIVQIMRRVGVCPHRTTLSRWFGQVASGYKCNRQYSSNEVKSLLILAFLYKAKVISKANISPIKVIKENV